MPRLSGDGNVTLTDDVIAKEALRLLKNELIASRCVNTDVTPRFGEHGDTISVKLPARVKSASGRTLQKQPMVDKVTTLVVDNQEHVGLEFNAVDRSLSITEFSSRYLKSATSQLAHAVDKSILMAGKNGFFNSSGTPGTTPDTDEFIDAAAAQTMLGHPNDGMSHNILNPLDAAGVRKELKTLYNGDMVRTAVERSYCGPMAGSDSYETAQMVSHTVGAHGGTPLVAGASQSGSSLNIDGGTNSTAGFLKAGDVFTIAGVFSVNPRTYESTGMLQQFVVTADAATDGSGATTLSISPEINDGNQTTLDKAGNNVSTRAFQNVTALPADNAAITVMGAAGTTYRQNLLMHRDAITLAPVDFVTPETAPLAKKVRDEDSGLSILMTGQYTINDMTQTYRLDVLWAVKALYPELGRRVWGG